MPKLKLHAPGKWGEKAVREYSYSMVLEVGNRVELSGQGGWKPETLDFPVGVPIEAEIHQAFDNISYMLDAVGLGWSHVAHGTLITYPKRTAKSHVLPQKWVASSDSGCQTTNPSGPALALRHSAIPI